MKETRIIPFDDLDRAEKNEKNEADHTRFLGWEGQWYELDLTTIHTLEIEAFLERYLKAGIPSDNAPTPKKKNWGIGGSILEAHERNKAKAAWCDAHGLPYTNRKAGGFYFPVKTEQAYQEAQRGTGPE